MKMSGSIDRNPHTLVEGRSSNPGHDVRPRGFDIFVGWTRTSRQQIYILILLIMRKWYL